MATVSWLGGAARVRQLSRATPANVNIGNTFTITINGKAVTFTATAATVANVTAGLAAACAASTEPEFTEVAFADNTTYIGITGPTDGRPFTFSASASGGTATNTASTPTAASGPNSWAVGANWVGGSAPGAGDNVIIDNSTVSILYGLDTTAVTFGSITFGPGWRGDTGLPERNALGYAESRDTHLKIKGCPVTVNAPQCGRIKIFSQTSLITLNVFATGSPADSNYPALLWYDAGVANNVINVTSGSVGLAALPGQTATLGTLRVGGAANANATAVGGTGLTLTTANNNGGSITLNATFTTLNQFAGTTTVFGSAAATTLNVDGGTVFWQSSGTITTVLVGNGGTMDYSRDIRARTVTNSTVNAGAGWVDPVRSITYTNSLILNRCSIADLRVFDVGTHVTLAISSAP